jgi:hypothetical protein
MNVAVLPWAIDHMRKGITRERERKEIQKDSIKRTVYWYRPVFAPFDKPLDRPIKYLYNSGGSGRIV